MTKEFDYISEAKQTLSQGFHSDKVKPVDIMMVFSNAINALQELDKIKKTLFYGKKYMPEYDYHNPLKNIGVDGKDVKQMITNIVPDDELKAANLFHGIVGAATETGEMLEALAAAMGGKEFDTVNLREEVGDVFWYLAILADNANFTFDESQRTNIAKLRKRYPDNFTEYDAQNRDLTAERQILEA